MPVFRPDLREIPSYTPGRPIADVAEEYGFDPAGVVKLASNELPFAPLEPVMEAMRKALLEIHRYPDTEARRLRSALSDQLDVAYDEVMVGAGSSEILRVVAMAIGGPGTSAVYAWPSFVIYRLGSILAMSDRYEVPLDGAQRHDLRAMAAAITPTTRVVYICNPNNPTGTLLSSSEVRAFVDAVPESVLVLVDEAYGEFVTEPGWESAATLALERPNVMVTRTFSKIHGLAALRIGYAISRADTIAELRKVQAPFSVTSVGLAAALESLRYPQAIADRVAMNAAGRDRIQAALGELGIEFVPSHSNFICFRLGKPDVVADAFLRHRIILRPFGEDWVRVTVGTERENGLFLTALRAVCADRR
ncbi:MAG: histidinol-phosphate transaminase [Acidimicrobiia bacterium]|nr:histidinol-phosphate transaminase [Acidimicrobiia bacterium]